jgi:hypothetical protein
VAKDKLPTDETYDDRIGLSAEQLDIRKFIEEMFVNLGSEGGIDAELGSALSEAAKTLSPDEKFACGLSPSVYNEATGIFHTPLHYIADLIEQYIEDTEDLNLVTQGDSFHDKDPAQATFIDTLLFASDEFKSTHKVPSMKFLTEVMKELGIYQYIQAMGSNPGFTQFVKPKIAKAFNGGNPEDVKAIDDLMDRYNYLKGIMFNGGVPKTNDRCYGIAQPTAKSTNDAQFGGVSLECESFDVLKIGNYVYVLDSTKLEKYNISTGVMVSTGDIFHFNGPKSGQYKLIGNADNDLIIIYSPNLGLVHLINKNTMTPTQELPQYLPTYDDIPATCLGYFGDRLVTLKKRKGRVVIEMFSLPFLNKIKDFDLSHMAGDPIGIIPVDDNTIHLATSSGSAVFLYEVKLGTAGELRPNINTIVSFVDVKNATYFRKIGKYYTYGNASVMRKRNASTYAVKETLDLTLSDTYRVSDTQYCIVKNRVVALFEGDSLAISFPYIDTAEDLIGIYPDSVRDNKLYMQRLYTKEDKIVRDVIRYDSPSATLSPDSSYGVKTIISDAGDGPLVDKYNKFTADMFSVIAPEIVRYTPGEADTYCGVVLVYDTWFMLTGTTNDSTSPRFEYASKGNTPTDAIDASAILGGTANLNNRVLAIVTDERDLEKLVPGHGSIDTWTIILEIPLKLSDSWNFYGVQGSAMIRAELPTDLTDVFVENMLNIEVYESSIGVSRGIFDPDVRFEVTTKEKIVMCSIDVSAPYELSVKDFKVESSIANGSNIIAARTSSHRMLDIPGKILYRESNPDGDYYPVSTKCRYKLKNYTGISFGQGLKDMRYHLIDGETNDDPLCVFATADYDACVVTKSHIEAYDTQYIGFVKSMVPGSIDALLADAYGKGGDIDKNTIGGDKPWISVAHEKGILNNNSVILRKIGFGRKFFCTTDLLRVIMAFVKKDIVGNIEVSAKGVVTSANGYAHVNRNLYLRGHGDA